MQLQEADQAVIDALGRGRLDEAQLEDRERVLLELVELLTKHSHRTTQQDIQRLRDHGYRDAEIAEAVYITALFAFFNRVADAFGLQDPGYLALAAAGKRAPRPAEQARPD